MRYVCLRKANYQHKRWSGYQFSFSKRLIIRIIFAFSIQSGKGCLVNFTRIGHLNITHVHRYGRVGLLFDQKVVYVHSELYYFHMSRVRVQRLWAAERLKQSHVNINSKPIPAYAQHSGSTTRICRSRSVLTGFIPFMKWIYLYGTEIHYVITQINSIFIAIRKKNAEQI